MTKPARRAHDQLHGVTLERMLNDLGITVQSVREVAQELDYRPNSLAVSLR